MKHEYKFSKSIDVTKYKVEHGFLTALEVLFKSFREFSDPEKLVKEMGNSHPMLYALSNLEDSVNDFTRQIYHRLIKLDIGLDVNKMEYMKISYKDDTLTLSSMDNPEIKKVNENRKEQFRDIASMLGIPPFPNLEDDNETNDD